MITAPRPYLLSSRAFAVLHGRARIVPLCCVREYNVMDGAHCGARFIALRIYRLLTPEKSYFVIRKFYLTRPFFVYFSPEHFFQDGSPCPTLCTQVKTTPDTVRRFRRKRRSYVVVEVTIHAYLLRYEILRLFRCRPWSTTFESKTSL